ncbi:MAG: hypothetical protein ABIQ89_01205 [Candidatus Saccharimonadales bacterium]
MVISSDLDLQVLFQRTVGTEIGVLIARLGVATNTYGFYVNLANNTTNTINYRWSPTGASAGLISKSSTGTFPMPTGTPVWVRVTHDVDNGASGNDVRFYRGVYNGTANPPTTWTQVGSTVTTAGTTSIFNPTTQGASVGSYWSGGFGGLTAGARIYRGIVKDGIDGPIVVDINPTKRPPFVFGSLLFLDDLSTTVPLNNILGDISGGVAYAKTRVTASGRVSAP